MTRAGYLRNTTVIAGVLTAVGTVFWYLGSPVFRPELAGVGVPVILDAVLLVPAAVVAGADIARRAWFALRSRTLGIELLVTVAAVGAIVLGEFFEAAAVTFLFALGGYLENRAMTRTRDALRSLWQSVPRTATVITEAAGDEDGDEDGEKEVPAQRVQPGDLVLVRPGGRIPVDGTVERGESSVDESTITGESVPADKESGSSVYSATVNHEGLLYIRTERAGADTTVARIIARVEEAQDSRTKSERVIDRFARYYTPAVMLGSLAYFLATGNVHIALTLLVVACPGALVIAAPVAVISSIGRAAKRGVLVRGGSELETAANVTVFATDKTGTLTTGELRVVRVSPSQSASAHAVASRARASHSAACREGTVSVGEAEPAIASAKASGGAVSYGAARRADGAGSAGNPADAPGTAEGPGAGLEPAAGRADQATGRLGGGATAVAEPPAADDDVLRWAAIAEAGSEHPIGRAIRAEGERRLGRLPHGEEFRYETGRGISAVWNGHRVEVARSREEGGAETTVAVSVDGETVGTIALSDTIRPDARRTIAELGTAGVGRTVLLTGDNRATAESVATEAGITEVHAGLLPEEKLEHIRALQAEGETVAMLGDGINDAPSLAAADVGIAMGAAGSDLAIESADLALMSHHLTAIPDALRGAKRAIRVIRQNLGIALVTVILLFAGVLAGQIHMAGGMLVHQGSILLVIANGLRLRR